MPKLLSSTIQTLVATKTGLRPILFIKVDWPPVTMYSIGHGLLSLGDVSSVVKLNKGGTTSDVSVVLDDSDGKLKEIFDTLDIHKREVSVYQSFEGLDLLNADNSVKLFKGYINTPITYNDNPRQLSFRVINSIEEKEIGFSPEQHAFPFIAEDAVGKAWPLCFGNPIHVPAVKVTELTRGKCRTKYNVLTVQDINELYFAQEEATIAFRKKELTDYYINAFDDALRHGFLAQFLASLEGVFAKDFLPSTYQQYLEIVGSYSEKIVRVNKIVIKLIAKAPNQEQNIIAYAFAVNNLVYYSLILNELTIIRDALLEKIVTINNAIFSLQARNVDINKDIATYAAAPANNKPPGIDPTALAAELLRNLAAIVDYRHKRANFLNALQGNTDIDFSGDLKDDAKKQQVAERAATTVWDLIVAIERNTTIDPTAFGVLQLIYNGQFVLAEHRVFVENLFAVLVQFTLDAVVVEGAEKFEQAFDDQDEPIPQEIIINNLRLGGWFENNVFHITEKLLPTNINVDLSENPDEVSTNINFWLKESSTVLKGMFVLLHLENVGFSLDRVLFVTEQEERKCTYDTLIWYPADYSKEFTLSQYKQARFGGDPTYHNFIRETCPLLPDRWILKFNDNLASGRENVDGQVSGIVSGQSYISGQDWGMDIGDDVFSGADYKDLFIVSLNPINEIKQVSAFRQTPKGRRLVPVPSRYYEKNLAYEIAGQTVAAITFKRPLSGYLGENWEDQVYVTVQSDNSNTTDAIKYLIETYSAYDTDDTSFDAVKAAIAKYPSHFALIERKNVLDIIEEIAWQARCATFVSNGIAYIKYLSAEPIDVATLNSNNVIVNSVVVELSSSDELVTKFTAKWKPDGALQEDYKIILRNNINKYGLHEENYNFYIYNIESLVTKSAMFWMLRYSNTWKSLNCSCGLDLLKVEPLDAVTLAFDKTYIATNPCLAVVEEVNYHVNDNRIDFKIWTPVRAGTVAPYVFAWPATALIDKEYPTDLDLDAGGGDPDAS